MQPLTHSAGSVLIRSGNSAEELEQYTSMPGVHAVLPKSCTARRGRAAGAEIPGDQTSGGRLLLF